MTGIRKLRWLAAIPALMVLFASATVAYGGLRWIGMDPSVILDDSQVDITVFWPESATCSIDGPIEIGLLYPSGVSDVRLVAESQEEFACDGAGGEVVTIVTATSLEESADVRRNADKVRVTTLLSSKERFPVRVEVALNGETARECGGRSNSLITCGSLKLSGGGR